MLKLLLPKTTSDSLTITLLNTRSLRKHSDDILNAIALVNNDIFGLTETRLHFKKIHQKLHQNFKIVSECILALIGISMEILYLGMFLCNS